MKRFAPLTLFVAVLVAGCGDGPAVTGPDPIGPGLPSASISDGAHSDGNPDFFFLPPLVKDPSGNPAFKDDPFDASVASQVTVEICKVGGDPSGSSACPVVKTFTSAEINVSLDDESYHVNWDTKEQVLDELFDYRIQVLVGDVVLGFADADVVDRGNELKNVETGEYIALLDGRTLPIKFRIEQGALCQFDPCATFVVDNAVGGTFFFPGNIAGIWLQAGALPYPFGVLTIQQKPVLPGMNCVDDGVATGVLREQWEGCFIFTLTPEIEPGASGFQKDVGVGVCAERLTPTNAVVLKHDAGRPLYQGPSFSLAGLNCDGYSGTPDPILGISGAMREGFNLVAGTLGRWLGPKSAYALDGGLGCLILAADRESNDLSTFFYGQPLTATAEGYPASTPQVPIGGAVPRPISVKVTTLGVGDHDDGGGIESHEHVHDQPEPVANVPVTFTVGADGGMLFNGVSSSNSIMVLTDESGIATLDQVGLDWVLGMDEGPYTLTATGPFSELDENKNLTKASVTFTADGVSYPDLIIASMVRSPAAPTSLDPISYDITIRNQGTADAPQSSGQLNLLPAVGTGTLFAPISIPAIAAGATATVTHNVGVQPAGSYSATFIANVKGFTESDHTNNSATDAFTVTQAMTNFAGRITDAQIATLGLGGATVTLQNVSTGQSWPAVSDATGAYTFVQPVPAATYTLGVSRLGYTGQSVQIAPTAGNVTRDFALTPITQVKGVVVDARGGCHVEFQNLTVSLTGTVGGVAVSETAITDDGKCGFVFTGVSAGTYTVTAPNPTGWTLLTSQVQVTVPGTNVDVDVPFTAQPLNGVVTGVLQASDDLVYPNWRVDLISGESIVSTTTTNSNGRYGFANVPPGTYSVDVLSSSGQTVATSGPFDLAPSDNKTVDITLITDLLPGPVPPVSTTPLPPPTGCTLTCTFSP